MGVQWSNKSLLLPSFPFKSQRNDEWWCPPWRQPVPSTRANSDSFSPPSLHLLAQLHHLTARRSLKDPFSPPIDVVINRLMPSSLSTLRVCDAPIISLLMLFRCYGYHLKDCMSLPIRLADNRWRRRKADSRWFREGASQQTLNPSAGSDVAAAAAADRMSHTCSSFSPLTVVI